MQSEVQCYAEMEMKPAVVVGIITMLCLALLQPAASQGQRAPPPVETPAPAPAPSPRHVNLTDLLSLAGPYGTFLSYLVKTDVIRTFQSQANDTDRGVTIFAPEDSAFAALDAAALSNLTADQLRTLMLCHAMPAYRPLSSFSALAGSSGRPVPTFAGGARCAVNVTYDAGRIRVVSSWGEAARLVSSVYSTPPAAVYALDRVLLPDQVFPTEPAVAAAAPAPAPAPVPRGDNATDGAPTAAADGDKSSSCRVSGGRVLVGYLALMGFQFLFM